MGKGCDTSTSVSTDMSSTSDSDKSQTETCHRASKREHKASKQESKREVREAKRSLKKTVHEAKKKFKAECKAAKKVLKEAKKAQKAKHKAAKSHCHNDLPSAEGCSNMAAPDFSFPVELGDGRKLTISWNKSDSLEKVAVDFAAQHQIASDELPTIAGFMQHAMAAAGAESAPAASDQMDVSDAKPSAPPYTGCDEEQLQVLEQMGFPNRELNMQLLAAHDGSLEKALQQLL